MVKKISIDPLTRIEGHLKVEVEVKDGKVSDAQSMGEMFRGWEIILKGRDPRDAQMIAQRICGVCPSPHAQASTLCLDDALGVHPPDNGRIIRNLILGADYLQSHVLHFYHLCALDYVDITAILRYRGSDPGLTKLKEWARSELDSKRPTAVAPFLPRFSGDYITDTDLNIGAIAHYVEALAIRRKVQEMSVIFAGRLPHQIAIMPGGVCERPTVDKITAFLYRLKEIQTFIETAYIPDVIAVAKVFPKYFEIGKGCGNLLSYGVFEQDNAGSTKFLSGGVSIGGKTEPLDPQKITEHVKFSRFSSKSGLHPSQGETAPQPDKKKAYSWLKAPRYGNNVCEVGPLARMGVNHFRGTNPEATKLITDTLKSLDLPVTALFSVLGRHAARALEARLMANQCAEWVMKLDPSKPVHTKFEIPKESTGMGLTEGPRGALGHWIGIKDQKIDRYQCVVPTTWNCSPRDDKGNLGAVEQALLGTPVADPDNPIEVARVVRSFDPCLACAIHILEPDRPVREFRVV